MTASIEERKELGQFIYDKFLSKAATEPVNVDSLAKNVTPQQLQNADVNLFQTVSVQTRLRLYLFHNLFKKTIVYPLNVRHF